MAYTRHLINVCADVLVWELIDNILFFTGQKILEVVSSPVCSLKSFPQSHLLGQVEALSEYLALNYFPWPDSLPSGVTISFRVIIFLIL